jgi:hypothetical protein
MIDREIEVELDVAPRVQPAGVDDPQPETVEQHAPERRSFD